MANPYSPSFRPILSSRMGSALSGLAHGALSGYELARQRQQDQANADFRQQELAMQRENQDRENSVVGYTPPGAQASEGEGLGAALRSAAGVGGIAGVLPGTDTVNALPRQFSPGGINYGASLRGQDEAARAAAMLQGLGVKNQYAAEQQAQRAADARALARQEYGDFNIDSATGRPAGTVGPRIVAAYEQSVLAPYRIKDIESVIGNRAGQLGLAGQRLKLAQQLGAIAGAKTVQGMQQRGQANAQSAPSSKWARQQILGNLFKNGQPIGADSADAVIREMQKAGLIAPDGADTSDADVDPMQLLEEP